jgi:putative isomerase
MTDPIYLDLLKDCITLDPVPFTERDSRLLVFRTASNGLWIGLAEYEIDARQHAPIPAWHYTDAAGQPLACTFTSYPHQLLCRTAAGTFRIAFVDAETLLVALPAGRCGITLQTAMEQAQTDGRGGVLWRTGISPCYLAYTTSAALLQNEIHARSAGGQEIHLSFDVQDGAALLLTISRRSDFQRAIPAPDLVLAASEQRWHAWFAAAPPVSEEYRRQYYYAWWVLCANLLYPYAHPEREGMVPSKLGYVGIWHWDSYFHAIALRHIDSKLAQDQIRIMLDHQLTSGLIPDIIHDEGILAHTGEIVEADITKPPLTAWAVWKLFEIEQDHEFLREVYEPVVRSQNWWFRESDPDGNGLCEYLHPWSSGLDNSPLWDQGLPVEAPDLNAYLCMQYDYLGKIATALGRHEEARGWSTRAEEMARRMVDLRWDEKIGSFWAVHNGARLPVRTPFQLFPLITGRMPEPIARRLVATLTDERQFWSHYPVPTVAFDDPAFNPLSMWRGPVWLNVNYLLIDGLWRTDYREQARELRRRTIALAMAADDFYEYYHPISGARPPRATNAFGWSAALFIDLVIAASHERNYSL